MKYFLDYLKRKQKQQETSVGEDEESILSSVSIKISNLKNNSSFLNYLILKKNQVLILLEGLLSAKLAEEDAKQSIDINTNVAVLISSKIPQFTQNKLNQTNDSSSTETFWNSNSILDLFHSLFFPLLIRKSIQSTR